MKLTDLLFGPTVMLLFTDFCCASLCSRTILLWPLFRLCCWSTFLFSA